MKKKEEIDKVKDLIRGFIQIFQIIPFIHWLLGLTGTTVLVVIIMPTLDLLVVILLWIVIMSAFVVFFAFTYFKKRPRAAEMLKDFIKPLIRELEEGIRAIKKSLQDGNFALLKSPLRPNYKYAYDDILGDRNYKGILKKVDEYNIAIKSFKSLSIELKDEIIRKSLEEKIPDWLEQYPEVEDLIKSEKAKKELLDEFSFNIASNRRVPYNNPNGICGFWGRNRDDLLMIREEVMHRECINEIKHRLNEAKMAATELLNRLKVLRDRYMKGYGVTEQQIEKKEEEISSGAW